MYIHFLVKLFIISHMLVEILFINDCRATNLDSHVFVLQDKAHQIQIQYVDGINLFLSNI